MRRLDPVRRRRGLLLLAAVALGLRVGVVLALFSPQHLPFAYEHGEIAENLLAGRGFRVNFLGVDGPTSQQAPFYPLLVAAAYRTFGMGSSNAVLTLQMLQAVAGTALVLCVVRLAWAIFPDRPGLGWIAGWGAAIYPTHIYMATHLQVAPWAALLLTWLTTVVLSPRWSRHWSGGLLAGTLAGLLLLVEPILVLALPILALALAVGVARQPTISGLPPSPEPAWRGLGRAALMAGVALAAISPWLWRNYCVHGEAVFIKSTFGYAFWQGNNAASWGTDKVPKPAAATLAQLHDGTLAGMDRALWEARHETIYIDDLLLKPGGYREFQGLSEPARSRLLQTRALAFVREQPGKYLQLCSQRLRYFLLWDETNPKAANLLYRATTLVWLALCAIGLWSRRADLRRVWTLLAIVSVVTLFHALTIVSARFRIPLEPLTFIWCAAAVLRKPGNLQSTP